MDRPVGRVSTLALTSLAHFINDGTVFFVPVIAAIVAANHSVEPIVVTVLFLGFYAASSAMSLYAGRLADRFGRPGTLMGIGLGVISMGLFGFYLTLSFTSGALLVVGLLLSGLVAGIGSSFYHPLGGALLQNAFHDRRRGLALGVNGAMGSLGRALYPSLYFVVGLVIAGYGSIALFAGIGVAAAGVIWFRLRTPGGEGRAEGPSTHSSREALTRGIVALTAVAFLRSVATRGIAAWIPTYLATQLNLGVSADLGIAVTITYIAAIGGQPLFGLLVDRVDKRLMLAIASLGSAVCTIGFLVSGSGWTAYAWLFAFGLFTFSGFPLLLSMVNDYVPRRSTSLANALVWGAGNSAGNALGPFIVGALIGSDYAGLGGVFVAFALLAVASSLATVFVPRATHVSKMAAFGG